MRAIANACGGFCFMIEEYEQGLTLFERESVLDLSIRDPMNRVATNILKNPSLSTLTHKYEYMYDPKIIVPSSINDSSGKNSIEVTYQGQGKEAFIQRITHEFIDLIQNPVPYFEVFMNEDDCAVWKIIYHGQETTVYEGGAWMLYVLFNAETYPRKPPMIRFFDEYIPYEY